MLIYKGLRAIALGMHTQVHAIFGNEFGLLYHWDGQIGWSDETDELVTKGNERSS